jgi:Family of unknown function (DUF6152)
MRRWAVVLITVLWTNGVAIAHHSAAMFDRAKTVELAGTVKDYQFANPHVWIQLLVSGADGQLTEWSIEGEGPAMMARMGLGPTALKVGDKITVRAHPLRDERPGGSFISITLGDGKVITTFRPPQ